MCVCFELVEGVLFGEGQFLMCGKVGTGLARPRPSQASLQ